MIGIDWGTSSLRAFRLGPDGAILDRSGGPDGILSVKDGDFAGVLRRHAGAWLADGERHVLLSGMIGSRQGWVEAPYLPCPADARAIAGALVPVPFEGADVRLVPGLTSRDADGTPEVMRGEETQIVGVLGVPGRATACLPGSHSKWASVADGRIEGFATYLSGEAFAALKAGTILGRMMTDGPLDLDGFDRGVARSAAAGHLLHHLFGVRTQGLFGTLADAASAGYLSGLLVGHEVRAALVPGTRVHLIGAEALTSLYARAIAAVGGQAVIEDSDAAAHGLHRIGKAVSWS